MKKFIIIISVIFLITFTWLALYVQSEAFSARLRPYVIGPLKAALGPDVLIGRVKASLIPLYLEVRDISIPDARGSQAVALHKGRAYLNPFPLLLKRISLPSLVLIEPRMYGERSRGGELNLSPLIERIKSTMSSARAGGASRFGLRLSEITVKQGGISFTDRTTSSRFSVSRLSMSAYIDLSAGRVKIAVKNSDVKVAAAAVPEIYFHLEGIGKYDRGRFSLDSVTFSAQDAVVSMAGAVGALPDADLDLKLTCRIGPKVLGKYAGAPLKPVQRRQVPRVDAAAVIKGRAYDPVIDGSLDILGVSVHGMQLGDAHLTFGYRNKNIAIEGKKWELSKDKQSVFIDTVGAALEYRDAGFNIKNCDIIAGDLDLRLAGRVNFSSGFDSTLAAESLEKGRTLSFLTGIPMDGKISVKGQVSGPLGSPEFDGMLSAGPTTIRGILFNRAEGKLRYQDKKIVLSETSIHQQTSRYLFDGSVELGGKEPVYEALLTVVQSDVVNIVAMFYKPLPLKLTAAGELSFSGSSSEFTGRAFLSLGPGSAYGESFDSGTITASLTKGKISFPQVELFKGSGVVRGDGWIGFDGAYSANVESRYVDLSEVRRLAAIPLSGPFKLDIHSSGSFSDPFVKASLESADFSYSRTSVGGFTAALEISHHALSFKAELSDDRARLAGKISLQAPYAWTAEAAVNSEAIDPFLILEKRDLISRVRVTAEGSVTARGRGADVSALSADASFQRLGVAIGEYRIDNESEAGFTVDAGRLTIASLNFSGPNTRLGVAGEAGLLKDVDIVFTGNANLSLLRLLYSEVEHGDGVAEIKLTISDAWNNPDISGELRVRNGELKIKDIHQKFTVVNGTINFAEGRISSDSLAAEVGGGRLNASGWAQLAGFSLVDFSIKAAVENVTVRYPEGLTSTLFGDLYYDGDSSEQTLTGDVAIIRARYEKRLEWKTMLLDVAKGFSQRKKTDVGWIGNTQVNIRFHGKDNILLQNNLAKLLLEVDVFIRGTVNQPQLVGRVESRKGAVYFRKNDFKILHGSADFIDPNRLNPVLDIQAETRVREYLVRLAVTGTADRAVVTFMSEPSLSDTDILSLLALGKTGAELKGKEAGVGVGEAASFATGQFQDMFERRARSFTGLDRFQVDPTVSKGDTSVPRVTVGKELVQDKLYVTYSSNVGASSAEQVFRLEYIMDKHLSLVGERNEIGNIGADVKFRFEFR